MESFLHEWRDMWSEMYQFFPVWISYAIFFHIKPSINGLPMITKMKKDEIALHLQSIAFFYKILIINILQIIWLIQALYCLDLAVLTDNKLLK